MVPCRWAICRVPRIDPDSYRSIAFRVEADLMIPLFWDGWPPCIPICSHHSKYSTNLEVASYGKKDSQHFTTLFNLVKTVVSGKKKKHFGSIVSWKVGCSMCGRHNLLGACHSQRRTVHLRCFFDLKGNVGLLCFKLAYESNCTSTINIHQENI